jgi:hypothetical protein
LGGAQGMAEFTKPVVLSLYSAERSLTLSPMAAFL